MLHEEEVVIIHLEKRDVSRLQYQNTNRLRKAYVEMVKQIVESEENNDEDIE